MDLCLENILLINANFTEFRNEDGSIDHSRVSINHEISIKIIDFGNSELFRTKLSKSDSINNHVEIARNTNNVQFMCSKQHLSIENESYLSPNYHYDNFYDARKLDSWSLGLILYFMLIGQHLYSPKDIFINKKGSGYWSLQTGHLQTYLKMNNLLRFINPTILSLIKGLLKINENQRFDLSQVIEHKWFKSYFKLYEKKIEKKSKLQCQRLKEQKDKMAKLPFYGYFKL